jgi:hypothetical protein
MILSFEFQYLSQNRVLENFLQSICEEFDIEYKIENSKTIVTLFVNAHEEKLESFADFLATRLPLSIFFKSSSVQVCNEMQGSDEVEKCNLTLPFTPKALIQAKNTKDKDYMSPFIVNEVGNAPFLNTKDIFLKDNKNNLLMSANEKSSFIALYEKISQLICENKKIRISSSNGDFIYTKVDKATSSLVDTMNIVATDLSAVEKIAVIRDNEIKALASLEKPSIRLKVNALFSAKEILKTNRVKIKLADDMLLQLICEKLYADGVTLLYRENSQNVAFDYSVTLDSAINTIAQIEICVLENGEILIVSGDGYSASSVKDNLKKFDDIAHAQFTSIIQEHDIFKEQLNCFYLSKTHNDKIMYISEDSGMLDLISFPIIRSFQTIFDTIKESTTGEKLFESYEKKFPLIVKNALSTKITENAPDNIYTMWGICAVILGMATSIEEGSEMMIELAEDYGGQKGPRIDYQLIAPNTLVSTFNFIKLIRSAMSFKLADTDDRTLAFGFLESFAYFLSDMTDYYKESLLSQKMLLCGSMFGIRRFSELSCRNIQATCKIAFNRELPIDN